MKKFPDTARGSATGRPVMVLFDVLGKKWVLRILWELHGRRLKFRDLQSHCDQVSPTVLNDRLKQLREMELIDLTEQGYGLSETGSELGEHLIRLDCWANEWGNSLKN